MADSGVGVMTPERWAQIKAIFIAATELPPDARAKFVECESGLDTELRDAVERLLESEVRPRAELETPAAAIGLEARVTAAKSAAGAVHLPSHVGKYKIISLLGSGQYGVVYLARQLSPSREVAVKVLRSLGATPGASRRFLRESQMLSLLAHPGIAQIFESEFDQDIDGRATPYIAMELVRGDPVTKYAAKERLSVPQKLALVAQACVAVGHAHQKGIIHKDLKPGNIMVAAQPDGTPHVKLIDFGLAGMLRERGLSRGGEDHYAESVAGLSSAIVGTLAYMAPEQARGGRLSIIDTRADVYSLGAVLYELLSGRTPAQVSGLSLIEALDVVTRVEPVALDRLVPECRGDIAWMVSKALERDPDRRYQSAGEFAADMERFLNRRPILARPPSLTYTLRKAIMRHRFASATCALAAASLTTMIAIEWDTGRRVAAAHEQARSAAAVLLDEVADHLGDTVGAGPTRLQMLDRLRKQLESFVGAYPNDVKIQSDYAKLLGQLGDAELELRGGEFALPLFDRALTTRRHIASLNRDASTKTSLSIALVRLGDCMGELGRRIEQQSLYEQALRLDQELFNANPNMRRWGSNLMFSYERLAHLRLHQGDTQAALKLARREDELADHLMAMDASNDQNTWAKFCSLATLSCMLDANGHDDRACELRERMLPIIDELRERSPQSRQYTLRYCGLLLALADNARRRGCAPEAAKWTYQCERETTSLMTRDPRDPAWPEFALDLHASVATPAMLKQSPSDTISHVHAVSRLVHDYAQTRNPNLRRRLITAATRAIPLLHSIGSSDEAASLMNTAMYIADTVTASTRTSGSDYVAISQLLATAPRPMRDPEGAVTAARIAVQLSGKDEAAKQALADAIASEDAP